MASMIEISTYVGQPVGIAFTANAGIVTFADLKLFSDSNTPLTPGVVTQVVGNAGLATPAEIGTNSGVYSVTFTPTSNGEYYVYANGHLVAHISVSAQSLFSVVKNIEDEALGSWTWNKVSGALTMLRQNGATLATYNIVDSIATSSRERLA